MYADNKKYLLDSIMRGVDRGDIKQGYILANLHLMPKPITNVKIIKNYYLKEMTVLNSISSKLYAYNQKMSIINPHYSSKNRNNVCKALSLSN